MITYNLETSATKSLIFQHCFFNRSPLFSIAIQIDSTTLSIYLCYFTVPMHNEILSTEIERLQWILSQIDGLKQ